MLAITGYGLLPLNLFHVATVELRLADVEALAKNSANTFLWINIVYGVKIHDITLGKNANALLLKFE